MLPRPKLAFVNPPRTPEDQAEFDNLCDTIARIIKRHVENPLPEFASGWTAFPTPEHKPGEARPRGKKRSNKRKRRE